MQFIDEELHSETRIGQIEIKHQTNPVFDC